jgi:hypothetical protein
MCLTFHIARTAYHPEVKGACALHARATAATWAEEIPWVLLGLCSQWREDTGFSLAEAVFGTPLVLQNEFLQEEEFSIDQISLKNFQIPRCPCFSSA